MTFLFGVAALVCLSPSDKHPCKGYYFDSPVAYYTTAEQCYWEAPLGFYCVPIPTEIPTHLVQEEWPKDLIRKIKHADRNSIQQRH
jgi:hypothetical protein